MAARYDDGSVRLEGQTSAEDAETALGLLLDHPEATLDLSGCTRLHTAALQVVLAAQRPTVAPLQPVLARLLAALLPSPQAPGVPHA